MTSGNKRRGNDDDRPVGSGSQGWGTNPSAENLLVITTVGGDPLGADPLSAYIGP